MGRKQLARLAAAIVAITLLSGWGSQRNLNISDDDLVQVEIATIGIASNGAPVVLLREPGARKVVPIFIGVAEAQAIARAMRGMEMPRPMTHDLFGNVLEALDVELTRVLVDDMANNAYLGMLELELPGQDRPLRIDSRPSDAMALALRAGASIHVAPKILEAAANIDFEGMDDEVVTAIGITVGPVTDELREALALPEQSGVVVTRVIGPAEEAGLAPGALLLSVNNEMAVSPLRFLELVRDTPADEKALIRFWQEGEETEIEVSTDIPEPRRRQRPIRIPDNLQES